FRAANSFPPTTRPTKRLITLPPKSFARLIQCRTRHAHIGSYYECLHIPEPHACLCGAFQTRNHVLLQCPLHTRYRHLLKDDKGEIKLQDILGTPKGCKRLVCFIRASRVFEKTGPQSNR
ncbi:hypothetical protein DL93DRAFT_2068233, partial [Clavulina sp. PMI_390]